MNHDIKIDKDFAKTIVKERNRFTNKGDYGRVGIIAGAKEMLGASLLSYEALAALRMGSGYSTLFIDSSLFDLYAIKYPQILLSFIDKDDFKDKINKCDVVAIGMGLDDSEKSWELLSYLINEYKGKLIIDGTAITLLAKHDLSILLNSKATIVLTPHLKEFSCLYKEDVKAVKYRLADKAIEFAKKYHVTVLVKDAYSFATDGEEFYMNKKGNTGLAKAGSGDLLAGILAGILSYFEESTSKSAIFSSYVLGRAAEIYALKNDERNLIYTDILDLIPEVFNELK